MTKRELVAALIRDPIVIEQVAKLTYYRVSPHGMHDVAENSVLIGLVPIAGVLLPEDFGQVYARADGKSVQLTAQEAAAIVARVQRMFASGERRQARCRGADAS
jgi:hypothetical protein